MNPMTRRALATAAAAPAFSLALPPAQELISTRP